MGKSSSPEYSNFTHHTHFMNEERKRRTAAKRSAKGTATVTVRPDLLLEMATKFVEEKGREVCGSDDINIPQDAWFGWNGNELNGEEAGTRFRQTVRALIVSKRRTERRVQSQPVFVNQSQQVAV